MEWTLKKRIRLSFSYLEVCGAFVGSDFILCVTGGERPHIGCTVQAVPRPSLTGDGTVSVTSSVMNVTGHKDEAVCRGIAEAFCRRMNATVVCTGGFHVDHITAAQIREVTEAVRCLYGDPGILADGKGKEERDEI